MERWTHDRARPASGDAAAALRDPGTVELQRRATALLRDVHRRQEPHPAPDELTFDTWIPNSARQRRRRLFVASVVAGQRRLVAKLPLDPGDDMVLREWHCLQHLPGTAFRVAEPVAQAERGFVMRYVPDADAPVVLQPGGHDTAAELMTSLMDGMASLHGQASASQPEPGDVLEAYLGPQTPIDERVAAALPRAPVGPTHGDLGLWNVRVAEGRAVGVIDWEDYRTEGLPVLDVLNVVLTMALALVPDYRTHGFDWLYDQTLGTEGPFTDLVRDGLDRYARAIQHSPADVMALFPLLCQWMLVRIAAQGRPTAHLVFTPFMRRYLQDRPRWVDTLER